MKKAKEILEAIAEKREAQVAMKGKLEAEKRARTEDEVKDWDKLSAEIRALQDDLKFAQEAEAAEAALNEQRGHKAPNAGFAFDSKPTQDKDVKKYSVMRALALAADNKPLDGIELEMHQEADKEARGFGEKINGVGVPSFYSKESRAATAGVTTEGGFTIEKTLGNMIDTVYDETFMAALGVRRITGLQGNIELPVQTAKLTVAQYAENATIANSDLVWAQKTLSPVRLGATTQISKQLLIQSSVDVERYIADQLATMFQLQLESRAYTAIAAAATTITLSGDTNGIAPTYDHMLQFEEALALANIRGMQGILTTYKMRRKLKGTTVLANSITRSVWEDGNTINGYKVAVSNLIPSNLVKGTSGAVCSAFIQGDFKEAVSAQWGGMDYLVNPYTFAKDGKIEIVAQMFNNELVTRNEAFVKHVGFLTT